MTLCVADGFPLDPGNLYRAGHLALNEYLAEVKAADPYVDDAATTVSGTRILGSPPEQQVQAACALLERLAWGLPILDGRSGGVLARLWALKSLAACLLRRGLPFTGADLEFALDQAASLATGTRTGNLPYGTLVPWVPLGLLLNRVETFAADSGLTDVMRASLGRLLPPPSTPLLGTDDLRIRHQLTSLLGGTTPLPLVGGQAWVDAALSYAGSLPREQQESWEALIRHAAQTGAARPSAKWSREAERLVDAVGGDVFQERVLSWLPLSLDTSHLSTKGMLTPEVLGKVDEQVARHGEEYRAVLISGLSSRVLEALRQHYQPNAAVLAGLIWCLSHRDNPEVCRAVGAAAESYYRKIPGVGPFWVKGGNACLFVLSRLSGLGALAQLSRLRLKVKHSAALSQIEAAIRVAAERAGMSPEDVEELTVPTYGLDESGRLSEALGDVTAEIRVLGPHRTEWRWTTAEGRSLKGPPARVKQGFAEELRALKRADKEIRSVLPLHRDRIERLYRHGRRRPLNIWRERYLDHPLMGQIARRLVWRFHQNGETSLGSWFNGSLVDSADRPIADLPEDGEVELWHPMDSSPLSVGGWRRWLEGHRITQPFKQAHREVYSLREEELGTKVFSNRFAGHIIKQHQLNALCGQKGWTYHLQGGWDNLHDSIARTHLPRWGLDTEFLVEAREDLDAASEMGIWLYVATDQVRFMRGGEPVPLEQVPPLAFSEVMRDVDLFVSVSSVGNDPAWIESNPPPRYHTYWEDYALGPLGEMGAGRHEFLLNLLPSLAIAPRCSVRAPYLVVEGDLCTYKIHLGSGHVVMEPENIRLILPSNRGAEESAWFLPFEDHLLSQVLSQAYLLAEDARIADPAIRRQIR
ncbi:MAG TPA: DUF4132 domain-containing protein [Armatimonadota bacterium]